MWNVYGSTVLFYSCGGKALNIVSIESGQISRCLMKSGLIKLPSIEIDLQM